MKTNWRLGAVMLLAAFGAAAQGQTPEIAWQVTDSHYSNALYVQNDALNNVFVVKQNPVQGTTYPISLDVYDVFGNYLRSFNDSGSSPATGFVLDPTLDTAAIGTNVGYRFFFWNGLTSGLENAEFALFALGMDPLGRALGAFADSTSGQTVIYDYAGVDNSTIDWTLPFIAQGAVFDGLGNVLIVSHTGSFENGSTTATYYSETGTQLWSRSYNDALAHRTTIGGFVEDEDGNYYLVVNTISPEAGNTCYVVGISNGDTTSDAFDSPTMPGTASIACDGSIQLLVAGQATRPFVAAVANLLSSTPGGTINWNVIEPASQMIAAEDYLPVVTYFDSSSNSVKLESLSPTDGSITSTLTFPGAASTDIGALQEDGFGADYVGSTGGTNPSAFIAHVLYGANLQSVVLPATVQGGAFFNAQINLTATPGEFGNDISLTSSAPSVVDNQSSFTVTTISSSEVMASNAVDSDTAVTVTANQFSPNVQRTANVTVKTAVLSSCSSSASTFNPSKTATGTVTLNGPAGPSGKVVSLACSNPSITVPETVKVLAGQTSVNFIISSHPVSEVTNPTITASLAGVNATTSVRVEPAPIKSLTVTSGTIAAGGSTTAEVVIATEAGPAGDVITTKSNTPAVTVPSTVTITSGRTYATFAIKANGVNTATVATLSAVFNGVTKFASVTVELATLSSVEIAPTSVNGGANAEATVHLTGPAGSSGFVVSLKSSNGDVSVPASITVAEGAGNFSFVLKTKAVAISTKVTITATLGATVKTVTLTLTP